MHWKKLSEPFACKSRDKFFKSNYSMIEQCLSNKNESAKVSKSKNFLDLNKSLERQISKFTKSL